MNRAELWALETEVLNLVTGVKRITDELATNGVAEVDFRSEDVITRVASGTFWVVP